MKLKKIASLMLAGVMAVSMLAGCSNGTKPDDDKKDPTVNTGMAGNVIAALDEDTTKNVEFTADSNLETVLKKAVQNAGFDNLKNQVDAEALNAIDSDISKNGMLDNVAMGGESKSTDKEESKATYVDTLKSNGMNDSTVVKQLAAKIDDMQFGKLNTKNVGWADLPEYSHTYTDTEKGDYWYDFAYTAGIAVVDVSDADTGETTYVVAVTVTRTPTQTYKHA